MSVDILAIYRFDSDYYAVGILCLFVKLFLSVLLARVVVLKGKSRILYRLYVMESAFCKSSGGENDFHEILPFTSFIFYIFFAPDSFFVGKKIDTL